MDSERLHRLVASPEPTAVAALSVAGCCGEACITGAEAAAAGTWHSCGRRGSACARSAETAARPGCCVLRPGSGAATVRHARSPRILRTITANTASPETHVCQLRCSAAPAVMQSAVRI